VSGGALDLRAFLALSAFALIALAPGISSLPPLDRDESRYAVSTTQMLETDDYVDIRFQDEPRYLQPAGIYWLQSAAVAALTEPEHRAIGAFRVPSLLGAAIAVMLTAWAGSLLFGRTVGVAAAVLLAVSAGIAFEARIAKTDAVLLAAITAAQIALLRTYLEPVGHWWRPALFWSALGVGMMVKGPIILLFCGLTVLALAIWDRRAGWLVGLRPIWGVPLLLVIVLPWHLAIGIESDWQFYARSVGRNLLGKVGESQQSHAGPPGYYLAAFTLTFWPGSLFAAFAVPFAWRRRAEPAVRFLIAWIVPSWIVYELVATKLPHYVIPTYPAIALLAAAALFAPAQPASRWLRGLGALYAVFWLVVAGLVAALAPGALWEMDGETAPTAILLGVCVLALSVAALFFTVRRRAATAFAAAAAAGVIAAVNTFALAMPRLDALSLSTRVSDAAERSLPCADPTLVSSFYREPSLIFLHGPDETLLSDTPAHAAELLAASGPCAVAAIDAREREPFLARAAALGLGLRDVGAVSGLNYSDGEDIALTFYAAEPAGSAQ
jgi:4-amino-4-deoxy-L-arabinose transferase-like glycosyltransferase